MPPLQNKKIDSMNICRFAQFITKANITHEAGLEKVNYYFHGVLSHNRCHYFKMKVRSINVEN